MNVHDNKMTTFNYRLASILFLCLPPTTNGFHLSATNRRIRRNPVKEGYFQPYALGMSILDDIKDKKDKDNELENFNPLNYSRTSSGSKVSVSSTYASERQVISLRKTTKSEVVNELVNTNGTSEAMNPILQNFKDFLLEPLEDDEAVLDPDSIYKPNMSRQERYQAYNNSMEERIKKARSPQGKQVLMAMQEFFLSFE